MKKKFNAKTGLVLALIVTFMSLMGAYLVMTNFFSVKVTTTTTTTSSGDTVSLRVYKPDSATAEEKAPAIVFAHGLSTTKECYTQYAIELSRRGYVVVTQDMLNHGGSDITPFETFFTDPGADGYGVYAAIKYMADLYYVDTERIGIAGHSMGGNATNISVELDNMSENPLIDSVFLASSNPTFKDREGNWTNVYGDRSVGVFYSDYDHVYFSSMDENGVPVSAQKFLSSNEAKSFAAFGADPSEFKGEKVLPGHTYTSEDSIRRIYEAAVIHPYAQGGDKAITAVVDFFQDTLEAPEYRIASAQIANIYQIFSILGLFGALAIAVFLVAVLVKTKFFSDLAAKEGKALRQAPNKTGKIWFWGLTILNCVFAFVSISLIFANGLGYFVIPQLPQQVSNIFALWALANGLFMLVTSFVSYFLHGKKQGETLKDWGVAIGFKKLLKSILLSLIAVAGVLAVFILLLMYSRWILEYIFGVSEIFLLTICIYSLHICRFTWYLELL